MKSGKCGKHGNHRKFGKCGKGRKVGIGERMEGWKGGGVGKWKEKYFAHCYFDMPTLHIPSTKKCWNIGEFGKVGRIGKSGKSGR